MVDQDQVQQMANQYSTKVREFDECWEEYNRATPMPSERDWQKEVEMEQNMRLVADMQMALQREIRCIKKKIVRHFLLFMYVHDHMMCVSLCTRYRAVAQKVDVLLTSGSLAGGGGAGGSDRGLASNLAVEISNIKTTEGNILHQLADLKYVLMQ